MKKNELLNLLYVERQRLSEQNWVVYLDINWVYYNIIMDVT